MAENARRARRLRPRPPRPVVRPGEVLFAVAGLPAAVAGAGYVLATLYAGALLAVTLVGLPLVAAGLRGARVLGALHRRAVARLLGEQIPGPEPVPHVPGVLGWIRAGLTDPAGWRALLYLILRLPAGLVAFLASAVLPAAALWSIGFPVLARALPPADRTVPWWAEVAGPPLGLVLLATVPAAVRGGSGLNRRLARLLLGPTAGQRRMRALERSRHALAAESTEALRSIERDLHDGTQAELVAIAMTLSLADDALGERPDLALDRLSALLGRARSQTDDAIAGLRRITRGINPVPLDAGLAAALPSLAASSPVPADLRLDLRERPDPAIERVVYFCAAELLTNVARHSGADSAVVEVTAAHGRVRLVVRDEGRGGAFPGGGSGLTGLGRRAEAVGGTLRITSPDGGPTAIVADLPARM
ncbi:sensor histidine kinase [Actinoallomurus soli]|uniref:sensor histidine kinase n=1 Tax=Actinoallomurus soli TaxID=2952535 RepID=UPI002093997C|nr:sensor domain-containing protein [Actinoallomurus soli]MCO5970789.1 sensor domain-containing protein [Actinoallomurus soli]